MIQKDKIYFLLHCVADIETHIIFLQIINLFSVGVSVIISTSTDFA